MKPIRIFQTVLAILAGTFGSATAVAGGPDVATLDLEQWISAISTGLLVGASLFRAGPTVAAAKKVKDAITGKTEPEIEYPTTSPCHQDCGCPSI